MDSDSSYLQKDFNPNILKVNQLKKIFIFHDIYFPTSAKKAQLVEIFENEVAPHSEKLLDQLKNENGNSVKPIFDATVSVDEDEEHAKHGKKKSTKKGSSGKKKSNTPDLTDTAEDEPSSKKNKKSSSTKSKDSKKSMKKGSIGEDEEKSFTSNNSFQQDKKRSKKRSSTAMEQEDNDLEDNNLVRATRSRSSNSASKKKSKTNTVSAGNFFDLSGSDMDTSEDFEKLINNNLKDSTQILKSPQKSLRHNLKEILGSNTKKKKHQTVTPHKERSDSISDTKVAKGGSSSTKVKYDNSSVIDSDELAKQLGITIQGKKPKKTFDPSSTPIVFNDDEKGLQNEQSSDINFEGSPTRVRKSIHNTPLKAHPQQQQQQQSRHEATGISAKQIKKENGDNIIGQSMLSKLTSPSVEKEQQEEKYDSSLGKIAKVIPLNHDDEKLLDNNNDNELKLDSHRDADVELPLLQKQEPIGQTSSVASFNPEGVKVKNENAETEDNEEDEFNVEEEGKPKENLRNFSSKSSFFSYLKYFSIFIMVVSFSIFGYWYMQKRIYVGYCGYSLSNYNVFPNPDNNMYIANVEDLLSKYVSPECIECPENAICHPFFDISCHEGYLEVKPFNYWISGKKCIPDIRRKRRIESMTHLALNILRQRNTNFECGIGTDLQAGLPLEDIHDILFETRSVDVSVEEFEEIWSKVQEQLEATDDIITFYSEISNSRGSSNDEDPEEKVQKKGFRSTSLKYLNPYCRTKTIINTLVIKYRKQVFIFVLFLSTCRYVYSKIMKEVEKKREIQKVSKIIIEKLKKQRSLAEQDSSGKINSFLDNIVLRDQLLSNDKRTKNRKWEKISKLVESNTFVRTQRSEIYGDIRKTWEWTAD